MRTVTPAPAYVTCRDNIIGILAPQIVAMPPKMMATTHAPLEGLSKTLYEVLDEAESTGMTRFQTYLTEKIFMPLDDDIQAHLEVNARDRISGTIKQRKGGLKKDPLPFVQAKSEDISNFSQEYRDEINARVLPMLAASAMSDSRNQILELFKKLHRSDAEHAAKLETFDQQDSAPNFHDLLTTHREIDTLREELQDKAECITVVDERLKLIDELTLYFKEYVLPSHEADLQFDFDAYVPPKDLYMEFGNRKVSRVDARLGPLLTAWENAHDGHSFMVLGKPYIATMKEDIWAEFFPKKPKAKPLSSLASRRTGTTPKSRAPPRPSTMASGRRSPRASPSTPRGGSKTTTRPPLTPRGGSKLAQSPSTPRGGSRSSEAATPADGEQPAPSKKILIQRDIICDRMEKDPAMFDIEDTQSKRVYIVDQQADPNVDEDYIKVVARIRPLQSHETKRGDLECVHTRPDGMTVELDRAAKNKRATEFKLSSTAGPTVSQTSFYDTCGIKPLIDKGMMGDYVTVFAYGQTGSGKTFSIAGPEEVIMLHEGVRIDQGPEMAASVAEVLADVLKHQLEHHGVMPRSARYMFDKILASEAAEENLQYEVSCSYVEIYNEQLFDLLNPTGRDLEVKLNVGDRNGFFVNELSERKCQTPDDVMAVFMEGAKNRKVSSHLLNAESSRSHALFSMNILEKRYSADDKTLWVKKGKVTFVDLAGSESVKTTQTSGKGLRETTGINTSLLSLSNIVSQIAKEGISESAHVPWRNSKLTMLLMESLANNGSTVMVACVSPSETYLSETTNTLAFATKAANISSKIVKKKTGDEDEIQALRADVIKYKGRADAAEAELQRLRGLLEANSISY